MAQCPLQATADRLNTLGPDAPLPHTACTGLPSAIEKICAPPNMCTQPRRRPHTRHVAHHSSSAVNSSNNVLVPPLGPDEQLLIHCSRVFRSFLWQHTEVPRWHQGFNHGACTVPRHAARSQSASVGGASNFGDAHDQTTLQSKTHLACAPPPPFSRASLP